MLDTVSCFSACSRHQEKKKADSSTGNVKGVLAAMFLLVTLPSQLALIAGFRSIIHHYSFPVTRFQVLNKFDI